MAQSYVYDAPSFPPDDLSRYDFIGDVGEDASLEGGVAAFYGQTFVAPSHGAVTADTLSLELMSGAFAPGPAGPLKFRVALVAAPNPQRVTLDDVLFETPKMVLDANFALSTIDLDLEATQLVGGSGYAWVIDTYSDRDGTNGLGLAAVSATPFDGGDFIYGGYTDQPGLPLSSFSLQPFDGRLDLAFRMTFDGPPSPSVSGVPEPQAWVLFTLGLAGLGSALRRRNASKLLA